VWPFDQVAGDFPTGSGSGLSMMSVPVAKKIGNPIQEIVRTFDRMEFLFLLMNTIPCCAANNFNGIGRKFDLDNKSVGGAS
jgi:hypothetical protein